jgi:flagellar basal body-associated protein FliL
MPTKTLVIVIIIVLVAVLLVFVGIYFFFTQKQRSLRQDQPATNKIKNLIRFKNYNPHMAYKVQRDFLDYLSKVKNCGQADAEAQVTSCGLYDNRKHECTILFEMLQKDTNEDKERYVYACLENRPENVSAAQRLIQYANEKLNYKHLTVEHQYKELLPHLSSLPAQSKDYFLLSDILAELILVSQLPTEIQARALFLKREKRLERMGNSDKRRAFRWIAASYNWELDRSDEFYQ